MAISDIPSAGIDGANLKPKPAPDHVHGNDDPRIKSAYDEDGVRRTALSEGDQKDAEEKEVDKQARGFEMTHPWAAWLSSRWLRVLLGGVGAGILLWWKACG